MATSIQVIRDQAEMFNDLDLLVLLRMMVEEVQRNPSQYHSIGQLAASWDESCSNYGPGVIDLKLGSVASTAAQSEIILLLSGLEKKLGRLGAVISAATLNERWAVPGVQFQDYSTSNLIAAIRKLRNLLNSA
jgi:hypothetical protein